MARRLAIVGNYPENRHLVPFWDEMTEIWVFNEMPHGKWVERWDADFQLHAPEVYRSPNNFVDQSHWDWLQQKHGKPIYMQAVDPLVPDSVEYPLEDVLTLIPYRYLRSSIAMALGLAILRNEWSEIGLYGINLVSNTEYAYQATNMAFWIGFAHGRGVPLRLHSWLDEFNQPIYGYDGQLFIGQAHFESRIHELEPANRRNRQELNHLNNEISDALLKCKFNQVPALIARLENVAMAAGEVEGALEQARAYAKRTDPIPRQEYERRSAQAQIDGEVLRAEMYHTGGKCEYVWNVWKQTGSQQAKEQLRTFVREKAEKAFQTGVRLGMFSENIRYMGEYDALITAAGGVRALKQAGFTLSV